MIGWNMTAAMQDHWNQVYRTKAPETVSWYQAQPDMSLWALDTLNVPTTASLIDVGGGASTLIDHLIARGWPDLTVLDIAVPALEAAQARLGKEASRIRWEAANVTAWRPDRTYIVWHDRAVFHFLTEPEQRKRYRRALEAGTVAGSLVIIATFAPDGPERCSELTVCRYDAAALAAELGSCLVLERAWREQHVTPAGGRQAFQWCVFRRI